MNIFRQEELAYKHRLGNSPPRTIRNPDPTFEDWTVHQQNEMLPTNSRDATKKKTCWAANSGMEEQPSYCSRTTNENLD